MAWADGAALIPRRVPLVGAVLGFIGIYHGDLILSPKPPAKIDQLATLGAKGIQGSLPSGLGFIHGLFADGAEHEDDKVRG
jgi:hypothetical protein